MKIKQILQTRVQPAYPKIFCAQIAQDGINTNSNIRKSIGTAKPVSVIRKAIKNPWQDLRVNLYRIADTGCLPKMGDAHQKPEDAPEPTY